jgi:hypothetical protein
MKHASGRTLARIGKTVLTLVAAAIGAAVLMNSSCKMTNKAPTVPVITGPSSGVVGVAVTFKATATDPESDSIAFQFDWGDTTAPVWSALVTSGETLSQAHTYADSGTFSVKAKAKDAKGKETGWCAVETVRIIVAEHNYPDSGLGWFGILDDTKWCDITPDGSLICATNFSLDSVTVIRTSDRTVLKHLAVGRTTWDVATSPDGSHMYLSLLRGGAASISLPSATVDTVVLFGTESYGIAVTPDGERVLVCAPEQGKIYVLNAADLSFRDSIDVQDKPNYLVVSSDGHKAYVSVGYNSLAEVDLDSNRLVRYMPNLGLLGRVRLSPDGTRLYAQDVDVMGLRVISLPAGTEMKRLDLVEPGRGDILLSPDGKLLIASTEYGLKYVDTETWAVVCSLPCGIIAGLARNSQFDTLYAVERSRTFVIGRRQ